MGELEHFLMMCNPASMWPHFEDTEFQDAVNEREQEHEYLSTKFINDPPSFTNSLASNIGSTLPVLCLSLFTAAVIF